MPENKVSHGKPVDRDKSRDAIRWKLIVAHADMQLFQHMACFKQTSTRSVITMSILGSEFCLRTAQRQHFIGFAAEL